MKSVRVKAAAMGILVVTAATLAIMMKRPRSAPVAIAQEVDVWVKRPAQETTGLDWPRGGDGGLLDMAAVESPRLVRLHLPGGTTIGLHGKLLVVTADEERVGHVAVNTSLSTKSFSEAIAEAEAVIRDTRIRLSTGSRQLLEGWKANSALLAHDAGPFIAAGDYIDGDLVPDVAITRASDDKWFVVFSITRTTTRKLPP